MENVTRRIKISYFDPDATDSSSDEQEINRTKKRKIHIIDVEIPNSNKIKKMGDGKFDGVSMRKWEKCCSEIRDPLLMERLKLGTSDTPDEVDDAYNSEKHEIAEKLRSAKLQSLELLSSSCVEHHQQKENARKKGGSRGFVLEAFGKNKKEDNEGEAKFVFVEGVQMVDTNGFLVGDFIQHLR